MKHIIFLLIFMISTLSASTINAPVLSINEVNQTLTIEVPKVDVGVSGFLVHHIAPGHSSILKNVNVISYDADTKIATLKMRPFSALKNNALPTGEWKPTVGDSVELAFGYSRALLIAPSEEIYHRITKSVRIQWIHPDLFATVLSYRGHPTPLKEDFEAMSDASSVGLLFIYLDKKVYTIDIKTFKILTISDAPLTQDSVKLPFYSRVKRIEANWWGEGSDELESYEPYYFELLKKYNSNNKALLENSKKFELGKKDDR